MKKLIFVLISVLLLAPCTQGQSVNEYNSASPDLTAAEATQTPVSSAVLPSPSPAQGFTSCKEGEIVSEYFYTSDIGRFYAFC